MSSSELSVLLRSFIIELLAWWTFMLSGYYKLGGVSQQKGYY